MSGEPFGQPDDGRTGCCFHCRDAVKQCAEFSLDAGVRQRARNEPVQLLTQLVNVHAGQGAQIEVQFALGANAVRVVAAVDVAEVERRSPERQTDGIVMSVPGVRLRHTRMLPMSAKCMASSALLAKRRIAGVAGPGRAGGCASMSDTLVHAHRPHPGRLADNRVAGVRSAPARSRAQRA